MTEVEMKDVANLIATAVRDESAAGEVGQRVASLVAAHPAYPRR
jgi:glycine/serine hydroxymethyltransferase